MLSGWLAPLPAGGQNGHMTHANSTNAKAGGRTGAFMSIANTLPYCGWWVHVQVGEEARSCHSRPPRLQRVLVAEPSRPWTACLAEQILHLPLPDVIRQVACRGQGGRAGSARGGDGGAVMAAAPAAAWAAGAPTAAHCPGRKAAARITGHHVSTYTKQPRSAATRDMGPGCNPAAWRGGRLGRDGDRVGDARARPPRSGRVLMGRNTGGSAYLKRPAHASHNCTPQRRGERGSGQRWKVLVAGKPRKLPNFAGAQRISRYDPERQCPSQCTAAGAQHNWLPSRRAAPC